MSSIKTCYITIYYQKKKFSLHLCIYTWSLSRSGLFATLWTVAHQAPLSMGFSRQEYRDGLSCLPSKGSSQPRDRTHVSYLLHWQMGSLPLSHLGNPSLHTTNYKITVTGKQCPSFPLSHRNHLQVLGGLSSGL